MTEFLDELANGPPLRFETSQARYRLGQALGNEPTPTLNKAVKQIVILTQERDAARSQLNATRDVQAEVGKAISTELRRLAS